MKLPRILSALLVVAPLSLGMISCTQMPSTPGAQAPAAASAAGTWKWSVDAGGNTISQSVALKQSGETLTGTFTDGFDDTTVNIKEGKIHNGQVTLTIVRPFMDAGELTLRFAGKLEGNAIKGTIEINMGDQPSTADWTATRGS